MTTYTLASNTNVSALTLVDGDTIDCNGFELSIDTQPTAINISVTSPLKNGTTKFVTGGMTANLSTWSFLAGFLTMIQTVPAGVTIGSVTAGSIGGRHGVQINYGTITNATGGASPLSYGVVNNAGRIVNAMGASGAGCSSNTGIVENAIASNAGSAGYGVTTNAGKVLIATGGAFPGVGTNNNLVITAIGGLTSVGFGVWNNYGQVLGCIDNALSGISDNFGDTKFVSGPDFQGVLSFTSTVLPVTTLYSIGPLSPLATIPPGVTVVTLKVDSGDTTEDQFLRQVAELIFEVIE